MDRLKKCSTCKHELPISSFTKNRARRDGLCQDCRSCKARLKRAYRATHPQQRQAEQARYRTRNPEKIREYAVNRYKRNMVKIKAQIRAWQRANPEKVKAYAAIWGKLNPEKRRIHSGSSEIKVHELADSYIRRLLRARTPLLSADLPEELIKLKREQLRLARELWKLKP